MKSDKVSQDVRALRLANKLRRQIHKKAGKLKTEAEREAVLAMNARLDGVIFDLEARQAALSAFVARLCAAYDGR